MARRLVLAAALVAVLLPVAGAGGADAQTPKRGGTVFTPPGGDEPACLNPFDAACNFVDASLGGYLGEVLEGAFEVGPDLRYRPLLVTGATIVSKKPFVVVYRIRPEARWSDGVPITASDFVFTHRIYRDHPLGDPFTDRRPAYRTIRRVLRVDGKTARVVFRKRYSEWRTLFEHVLPRHALVGQNITAIWRTRVDDPRSGRAIGSGPFLVGSWERGEQITLVRNPRYWGDHPAFLDRLTVRFPPAGSTGAAEMRAGNRDLIGAFGLDSAQIAELRDVPGVDVEESTAPNLEYLVIRMAPGGHPALEKKLVRQALVYGLDRDEIARVLSGDVNLKADSAVVPLPNRFYQPNWRRYRFDPARARGLLEQAGCERGLDRIYVCDGERMRLLFVTTAARRPARQPTFELIQAQLRRSGIEVEMAYAPSIGSLGRNILDTGKFDVALLGAGSSSGRLTGPYCGGQDTNHTGYCNRLTSRDFLDADASVDEAQRARALNRADAKLARDVPVIPLAATRYTLVYRSTIRGITPNPVELLWRTENWWLDD